MDELKQEAERLGIKVDARWSEATLREKIAAMHATIATAISRQMPPPNDMSMKVLTNDAVTVSQAVSAVPTMIPVKLLKNYRPMGDYEIVDEAPPPHPGVNFTSKDKAGNVTGRKLWANTIVKLPRDEVVKLLNNEAVSFEARMGGDSKPLRNANGDVVRMEVRKKMPLAERSDPLPV